MDDMLVQLLNLFWKHRQFLMWVLGSTTLEYVSALLLFAMEHTWYLSRSPRTCSCKFFLAGVNFYRFNAKNWQFTVYFAVIMQKNWQFSVYFVVIYAFIRCKFYFPKILFVQKKWQISGMYLFSMFSNHREQPLKSIIH